MQVRAEGDFYAQATGEVSSPLYRGVAQGQGREPMSGDVVRPSSFTFRVGYTPCVFT